MILRQPMWPVFLDRLTFALLVLLALTFAFEIPFSGTIVDATLTNVKVLELLVIGCWIASHIVSRRWPRFPRTLVLPVAVWLAVLLISTLLAPDYLTHTIRFLSRVIQGLLLAWIAYDLVDTPNRLQIVIKALIITGLVVALLGLAEAADIAPVVTLLSLFHATQTHVGDVVRVTSSLEYATVAAMVLEMLIPLMLAWSVTAESRWLRLSLMIAAFLSIVALVLTLTRSAILGLAVALVVMGGVGVWRRQRHITAAAVGTLLTTGAVIGLVLVVNPTVGLRLLSESENGWYQARYTVPATLTAHPNELLNVQVQVTNAGLRTWQATANPPFRLGYTLLRANDSTDKGLDGIRANLSADVPPGQSQSVIAQVFAPPTPGQYLIQWDMVEETVLWFSWRGSPLGSTQLVVAGTPVTTTQLPKLSPANHSTDAPPVERPALWGAALRMFRDHPLFGVGPDDFRWIYGRYLSLDHWDTNIHANSIYFEILVDTGLIGLLIFLWLNGRWLWQAIQCLFAQSDRRLWLWQLALVASLIAWFVHGIFDNFYEFAGTYILFWLLAGLVINLAVKANNTTIHHPHQTNRQEA